MPGDAWRERAGSVSVAPNCAARKASFCTFNKNTPENVIMYLRKSKYSKDNSLCVIKMVTVYKKPYIVQFKRSCVMFILNELEI